MRNEMQVLQANEPITYSANENYTMNNTNVMLK